VDRIFDIIQGLNRDGIGILLVEQNANMALSIAARGYVLQGGRIVLHDTAQNLVNNPMMRKAYLEL
jgi:branched-chain amino acid transport system ATP-binding protein